MLLPKRVKYRRVQRGRMTGKAMRGNTVNQGQYGLVALEPAWITSNQIPVEGRKLDAVYVIFDLRKQCIGQPTSRLSSVVIKL